MTTFTATQSTNNQTLNDIYVLTDPSTVVTINGAGTQATFTLGTVTVTLFGSGFAGTLGTGWTIKEIQVDNGGLVWDIKDVNGAGGTIDGSVLVDAINKANPAYALFSGNDNITGGIHGSFGLFGLDGNDVITALGGNTKLDGGPGNDSLFGALHSHDVFEFNSKLNSSTNVDTIYHFSAVRDLIELSQETFHRINHFGTLHTGEFHSGPTAPSTTAADIIYNRTNGHLFYDTNGTHAGGLVEFAVVHGHPALSASDFLVI